MPSKIIARLQDHSFVSIFSQGNPGVASIKNTYHLPEVSDEESISFDPERKLEEDEWFYVEPTEAQKLEIIAPYTNTIGSIDTINPIRAEDYAHIRAICLVEIGEGEGEDEGEINLVLTKVYPRFYTMTKKILKWEDGPALETQSRTIDFSAKVDAFWKENRLYFKSYMAVKTVFDGLENFYRVATEAEKTDFLGKEFFECEDTSITVKPRNLRKIAAIMDAISWDDPEIRSEYIAYANRYPNLGVVITDANKMRIESNKDLTKILNVLEERLYTTPITNQPREANSVSPILPQ